MRVIAIWAAISVLAACGGSSTSDPASSGGSSGTGGGAGTAGSAGAGGMGGSSGTGGSSGIGGSSGSGGAVSCNEFADQIPPPQAFTLRLINGRPEAIYLGGGNDCGPNDLVQLHGPNGPIRFRAGGCGHTCEALQQHGDWCADACMIPPVIVIEPGGHYDTSWNGTTFETFEMPESCYFEPEFAPATCDRQLIAPAGDYTATAEAFTALACTDVGICPCQAGSSGSCEIPYGATPAGEPIATKTTFLFPSESVVEITFY